jgi:glyoxylase-like metal-dependent hydrolase (beta-lactamase superfamily II)
VEVADGIVKVDGARGGNVYLVVTGGGVVVVDTGIPGNSTRILVALESLGFRAADLRAIVLTHWHPDHVGSAAALRQATGAPVAIGELDAPILAGGELPAKGRRAMRAVMGILRVRSLVADVLLRPGDAIEGLEVVGAPGHTAGSIALRHPSGVLFTGDAVLGDRHGRLRPPDPRLSLDPDRATASMDELLGLTPPLILVGHGAPVRHPTATIGA